MVQALEQAVRINIADSESHFWLGRLYLVTNQPAEAIKALKKCLELVSIYLGAPYTLGLLNSGVEIGPTGTVKNTGRAGLHTARMNGYCVGGCRHCSNFASDDRRASVWPLSARSGFTLLPRLLARSNHHLLKGGPQHLHRRLAADDVVTLSVQL